MDTNLVEHGNVAFMILATVLVFIMTPGLAFFYAGLVEKKHSLTLMLQIFIAIGVVTILWVFIGFSLVFGTDINGIIGSPFQYFAFKDITFQINRVYGDNIPFLLFFMYQLMFAIITLPLMTGAIVNRITIGAWLSLLVAWMLLVYFPVAHWVWGGGFLHQIGFVDFAGGTVIHITAAFSGLAAILFLGKRKLIENKKPFNMGLVGIGAALLLFGWFGFNAGGTLVAAEITAIAFTNTGIAAASGMIVWTFLAYKKSKHFSFLEPLIGAIAGLATITPASGYVTPLSSFYIGAIAAFVCYFAVLLVRKMNLDDVLDVWGVHGVGGFIGTIMIGLFAESTVNGVSATFSQIKVQLFGASIVAVYSMAVTVVLLLILDKTFSIRVTKEDLTVGLDRCLLNEEYDNTSEKTNK